MFSVASSAVQGEQEHLCLRRGPRAPGWTGNKHQGPPCGRGRYPVHPVTVRSGKAEQTRLNGSRSLDGETRRETAVDSAAVDDGTMVTVMPGNGRLSASAIWPAVPPCSGARLRRVTSLRALGRVGLRGEHLARGVVHHRQGLGRSGAGAVREEHDIITCAVSG